MKRVFQLTCLIVCFSFFEANAQKKVKDSVLHQLAEWMEGSFSNREQAESDTSFFDAQLHVKRIWTKRKDEYWFYLEQSIVKFPERPFRQKVLRILRKNTDTIECKMFEIEHAINFAGEWKKNNPLQSLAPDSLFERIGCGVSFVWNEEKKVYVSSSKKNTCIGDLSAATYSTNDLTVQQNIFTYWDRGWNTKGGIAWGSINGGYIFKRTTEEGK